MKLKIGYKIVRQGNDEMHLYSHSFLITECRVQYKRYEWAVPKKHSGSLCVFSDLDSARRYYSHVLNYHTRLFQCIYKPTRKKVYHRFGWEHGKHKYMKRLYLEDLPKGTVKASKVMLMEEIKL